MSLRIALAQINVLVGDIAGNCARIITTAQRARDALQADVVVFPELTLTGYPPEDLLLRPQLHHQVAHALEKLQREVVGIVAVIGYPEQDHHTVYNAAAVIGDGRIVGRYRKQHLPNYSVFDEKRYFTPGTSPCVVVLKEVPCAITICEDLWHPGPMTQAQQAGARVMLNLNASPFHVRKSAQRVAVLQERLREAALPVVYVNLVGGQDELVFDGDSLVMNAHGEIMARLPAFAEEVQVVDFSPNGEPRAVSSAEPLDFTASVYAALVLGVRDYVAKTGFDGVVIGSSGGIDSALSLCIAVDALGAARVEAVMMPSRYTAPMSVEDAQALSTALGIEHHVISIEPMFEAFLSGLAAEFSGHAADVTEENIQARCRGVILMAISNKKHKMVLTTGNKSEMAVGYATLYGDMAGGFAPLKDVPKTWVYKLATWRNRQGAPIPERILTRPPSAELAPQQKDADSLPPYEVLDPILEMYVEEDKSAEEIIQAGYNEAVVRRVITLVNRNEYKRRQAPPGVRITQRAFGRDRRYPIVSGFDR